MKFFRSVADEMKQVTWPTKKQLRKDTLVVIETSILFAALFFIYLLEKNKLKHLKEPNQ